MTKRINSKDVAREAGVSATTVSYVLNNNKAVTISQETRDRVLAAVQKLGYVPNQAAKTLGSAKSSINKSNLIGIVIPQTETGKELMFANPFYGDFISAVEYVARSEGFHLLISGVNADQSYIEIAKNRSLDGIIILGMYPSDDIKEYKQTGIPTVLVDCYGSDHFFHSVRTDDRYGGYLATHYLIEHGHRRIAFVSGAVKEAGVNEMRFLGYKDALKEAKIEFDKDLVFTGSVGYEYGIEAAHLIADSKLGITGAFATADIIAVGMIKGFQNAKLRVPEDISLIGFDDIYQSEICNPGLTTIRQNIKEKGKAVAKIVVSAAKNPSYLKNEVIIPLEIVERESVQTI